MRHGANPHCRCPMAAYFDWPLSWEEQRGPTGKECHQHAYTRELCEEPLWGEEPFPQIPSQRELIWGDDPAEGCSAVKPAPKPRSLQEASFERISDEAHAKINTSVGKNLHPEQHKKLHDGEIMNMVYLGGGPKSIIDSYRTESHTAYHSSAREWRGKGKDGAI